ncbi:MAG: hypothetical protein NT049_16165 [Planctomycetota bacterium]|nr:hypothetical protein [Planctomycetota bacterium]
MTDRGRDRAVRAFLRKATATLTLRHALKWSAAWLFLWGLVVLVMRAAFGADALPLAWGLSALAVIFLAALVAALRRRPSARSAYALVDRVSSCGGLVMAASETPLGAWESQVPPLRAPTLRWRDRRTPVLFAAACVFAAISFAVPQWFVAAAIGNPLRVEKEVADLKDQIEALKEEKILTPEQAAELEERLRQTAEAAKGEDPAKTWEALDHINEVTAKAARASAEEALREAEKLSRAEALAEGLANDASKLDPAALAEGMKELAKMVDQATAESAALKEGLSKELSEACKSGSLKPGQCGDLAKALGECREGLAESLKKLADAKLIDAELAGRCVGLMPAEGAGEGLAAFLKDAGGENAGLSSLEQINLWLDGAPGRGGVTRGRGDAPMTWKDPSSKEGAEFKEEALAPGAGSLKDSRLMGVSVGAPTVEAAGGPAKSGALNETPSGGGSANTRTVLPRHRGAVQRYFERKP